MTISGGRTKQLDIVCRVTGRTEQHVVIGFGELAAVD